MSGSGAESSVDTLMPPGLEPTPIPNLAEPALVAGEPTWALGGAPLNRENSFGSELGEVDSDDHEADIACMPLMSSAIALPAATEQPDMTNEDVDETDRCIPKAISLTLLLCRRRALHEVKHPVFFESLEKPMVSGMALFLLLTAVRLCPVWLVCSGTLARGAEV